MILDGQDLAYSRCCKVRFVLFVIILSVKQHNNIGILFKLPDSLKSISFGLLAGLKRSERVNSNKDFFRTKTRGIPSRYCKKKCSVGINCNG